MPKCRYTLLYLFSALALTVRAQTIVSVADFGAVPDDGIDDATALRAAAAYCRAHAGTTLVFPAGIYELEDSTAVDIERRAISGAYGRGIEVNTSGWRYGLGAPQPTDDVLSLYRDLGGTIVTIGSDSHKPEHLGAYLRIAQDRLRALGFSRACTYECGEPRFYEL